MYVFVPFCNISGNLPSITQLRKVTTIKDQQTSLHCLARGQPGLHIEWSSHSKQLSKYTSENKDTIINKISDLEIIQESKLTIHSNISSYIRDDLNNVSCVLHKESLTSATADCSITFSCATFYERGMERKDLTSLVVYGFDGKGTVTITFY